MVEVVAGRPVEAELHRPRRVDSPLADQPHRIAPADVRGIEQRAIGAVVDVELVAAALFDAHEQAGIFGAQRAARLAPQLGRIADRQRFEGGVDDLEIGFERRRLHARIGRREAAADIDDVDRDRRLDDRVADAAPSLRHRPPGVIAWLPTWKQMPSASAAWRAANSSAFTSCGSAPNFDAEAELGMVRADPEADEQVEVGRGDAVRRRSRGRSSPAPRCVSRLKVRTPCSK